VVKKNPLRNRIKGTGLFFPFIINPHFPQPSATTPDLPLSAACLYLIFVHKRKVVFCSDYDNISSQQKILTHDVQQERGSIMSKTLTLIITFSLLLTTSLSAAVIKVPEDQPTIQAGIDAATDGDLVFVHQDTYSGDGNRDLDFHGKAITVKSDSNPQHCVIDCGGSEEDPHRGFIFQSNEDVNSVVQGFTIKNGYHDVGGGIFITNALPTIIDNIFTNNTASTQGGAISCTNNSAARITHNTFEGNIALAGGGAIQVHDGSEPSIANNLIIENSDVGEAGTGGGGVLCTDFSSPRISNNIIAGNTSENGGGIYIQNCSSSLKIENNIIIDNSADIGGGGIYCATSSPAITNVTFVGNSAGSNGGGIYCDPSSLPTLRNSILWDDTPDEIHRVSVLTTVAFCDVQGGYTGVGNIDAEPIFVADGEPYGDYYLSQIAAGQSVDSPCLNNGDPASQMIFGATRTDQEHDAGILDMGYHYFIEEEIYLFLLAGSSQCVSNP